MYYFGTSEENTDLSHIYLAVMLGVKKVTNHLVHTKLLGWQMPTTLLTLFRHPWSNLGLGIPSKRFMIFKPRSCRLQCLIHRERKSTFPSPFQLSQIRIKQDSNRWNYITLEMYMIHDHVKTMVSKNCKVTNYWMLLFTISFLLHFCHKSPKW